jgi:hypothetical protein
MLPIGPNTGAQNTDTSSSKFSEISQSTPYSTHTKPPSHSSTNTHTHAHTHRCLKIFFFSCSRWTTELWRTIFPLTEMLQWNNSIGFKHTLEWYVVLLKCYTIGTMWHWNKINLVVSFNKVIVTISSRNVLGLQLKEGCFTEIWPCYINASIGTPNYNTMCKDVHRGIRHLKICGCSWCRKPSPRMNRLMFTVR